MSSTIIPPPRRKVESMVVPRSDGGAMPPKDSFLTRLRAALAKEGYDLGSGSGRKKRGDELSLSQLARDIDYDPSSFSRLLDGERMSTIKTIVMAARLARALKTTVEELVFGEHAVAANDDADSSGIRPATKQSRK